MFTYALIPNGGIQRSDGAFIPRDQSNKDYHDYLTWVAQGNTPTPCVVPSPGAQAAIGQLAVIDMQTVNLLRSFIINAFGTNTGTFMQQMKFLDASYQNALSSSTLTTTLTGT